MTGPFSTGNKELISQAKRNPILSEDDLIPSYWQQVGASFDKFYYETGNGIKLEFETMNRQRNKELSHLMNKDGYTESQINSVATYLTLSSDRPVKDDEQIGEMTAAEAKAIFEGKYSNAVDGPKQIEAKVKSYVTGEVQAADKAFQKGDAVTAKLLGGLGGSFTDPVVLGSMFIPMGQEFAIAKTGSTIAKILKAGAIEGAIGATAEAATIGRQRENAAFLGKEFTNWDAARNIALAGGGGFIFGSLIKSGSSAFDYIKEVRRGVDDAQEAVLNKIDVDPADKGDIRYMDDFAYTSERAVKGDEFKPLYGESMTNDQYMKHLDDSQKAYDEAADWGEVAETKVYQEKLPKVSEDIPPRIDDDAIYKEYLTESDRAYDKKLFDDAAKVDAEIPVSTRVGEEGETIIDTMNAKTLFKQLDDELSGLEAVAMCMRGGA